MGVGEASPPTPRSPPRGKAKLTDHGARSALEGLLRGPGFPGDPRAPPVARGSTAPRPLPPLSCPRRAGPLGFGVSLVLGAFLVTRLLLLLGLHLSPTRLIAQSQGQDSSVLTINPGLPIDCLRFKNTL